MWRLSKTCGMHLGLSVSSRTCMALACTCFGNSSVHAQNSCWSHCHATWCILTAYTPKHGLVVLHTYTQSKRTRSARQLRFFSSRSWSQDVALVWSSVWSFNVSIIILPRQNDRAHRSVIHVSIALYLYKFFGSRM